MKIRTLKQTGAVILTIIMLMSLNLMGVSASLAPTLDASGRDPERDVSLTIFKYEKVQELQHNASALGSGSPYAGIHSDGTEQTIPGTPSPIEGVVFQIEKVTMKSDAEKDSIDPDDYEPITGEGAAFLTTGRTNLLGKVVFSSVAADNTADAVLPGQGIYKVTELYSATPTTAAIADFIVSLPMSNPSYGEEDEEGEIDMEPWLYDVFAYPKNDIQGVIDKEIVEDGTIGNYINWRYSMIIPNDIETPLTGNESLVITDKLDYRLRYVTDSISGVYTSKDSTAEINLIRGADYTLSVVSDFDIADRTIQVLTISITEEGFEKLAVAVAGDGDETPMLYFSFVTVTNIDPDDPDFEAVYNGGELDYTNSAGHEYETEKIEEPDDPEVPDPRPSVELYGIKIYKINVNEETLDGATFEIYASEEDARSGDNPLISPDGTDAWEAVTDEDGYAYFYGLVEGTYYLIETKAPDGYKIINDPIEVIVDESTVDEDNIVQITVTNSRGFDLPSTGGMGTILFTAGGLAIIGIAVLLLIFVGKRKTKFTSDI